MIAHHALAFRKRHLIPVLVFAAAARVSRSHLVAALLTAMAVLLFPRLYAYPKLLLYISGLWLAWRYADRPGTARLLVGAVATAQRARWTYRRRMALALSLLANPALDALIGSESAFDDLPETMARVCAPGHGGTCHRIRYPERTSDV